jgi:ABC-type Fe3+ transport system permease subunit
MKTEHLQKWYLIVCIEALLIAIAVYFDFHKQLWLNDQTKLSFLITFIWLVSTAFIGWLHTLEDKTQVEKDTKSAWYMAESCLTLGMIGTVAGFLLMLGAAFGNIDVSNTQTLQAALSSMAVGMSTALYTTLVGLVASLFIKSQLINLEHYTDGLQ